MLGMNALLLVAGYGNEALVEKILRAGADPNTINDFGHRYEELIDILRLIKGLSHLRVDLMFRKAVSSGFLLTSCL